MADQFSSDRRSADVPKGSGISTHPSQPPPLKSALVNYHVFFPLNRNEMLVLHNLNLINLYMYIVIIYVNTGIVLINKIIVH